MAIKSVFRISVSFSENRGENIICNFSKYVLFVHLDGGKVHRLSSTAVSSAVIKSSDVGTTLAYARQY